MFVRMKDSNKNEIPLDYFIGRAPSINLPLNLEVRTGVPGDKTQDYLPGSGIVCESKPSGCSLTDPKYKDNEYSTVASWPDAKRNFPETAFWHPSWKFDTLVFSFAKNEPKYNLEINPTAHFPELLIDGKGPTGKLNPLDNYKIISGSAHNVLEEVIIPININFNYPENKDNFYCGNQPSTPTADEWRDFVSSNIDDLKEKLKKYHISITEKKGLQDKNGKSYGQLIIKSIENEANLIPAFDDKFKYKLKYQVGDKSTEIGFDLKFKMEGPKIVCETQNTIRLLIRSAI
jgi:hypothetical protein